MLSTSIPCPNMDFGLVFSIGDLKVGASFFNFWRPVEKMNAQYFSKKIPPWLLTRNFNTSFAYDIKINKDFNVGLSFLYHRISKFDTSVDFSGEALFFKTFLIGGAWRVFEDESITKVFLGIQRWEYFTFQVSLGIKKEDNERRNIEMIFQYDL